MNKYLCFAAVGLMSACMTVQQEVAGSEGMMLMTQAEFDQQIVGRTLEFEGNTLSFNADGTLSGPWNGDGIRGTWQWVDGAVCREATIGTRVLDPDCQTIVVNGSVVTVTRDRGAGMAFDYNIL